MNWNKWAAISEIFSSIAILVTLGYLAIQIQQNTVTLNAESRTTLWELHKGVLDHVIQNPSIVTSWDQPEPLTDAQKVMLGNWLFEFVGQREFMWLQYQSGIVDEQTMETMISDIDQLLVHRRLLDWWNLTSDFYFDPGFVQLVNARASDGFFDAVPDWLDEWQ